MTKAYLSAHSQNGEHSTMKHFVLPVALSATLARGQAIVKAQTAEIAEMKALLGS
jgi:hypothetical protein